MHLPPEGGSHGLRGERARRGSGCSASRPTRPPRTTATIARWDNRAEKSNQDLFGKDSRGTVESDDDSYGDVGFETVVGVVVTTAP